LQRFHGIFTYYKKNVNVIKLQFFLIFLGVEIDSETANVIRIFEDKPLMLTSDFDTSATDDTTDDEDDTKSMRSRQVLAKRRLNLTPGLPEDTTYSMREFMHGKFFLSWVKLLLSGVKKEIFTKILKHSLNKKLQANCFQ
jgi:hypothetical protein